MFLFGSRNEPFELKPLNCFFGARGAETEPMAGLLREKPFVPTFSSARRWRGYYTVRVGVRPRKCESGELVAAS
jgi:hypothetical protein